MNKLSFKLGVLILICIMIVEGILFFFLYTNLANSRIEEVLDNLLARGNSHRDVLEKSFNESTLNHVALMESEADTIVMITDDDQNVIAQSEPMNDEIKQLITKPLSDISHRGVILNKEWKSSSFVASVSPIQINGDNRGYVYMFSQTTVIKSVINQLSNQFLLAGLIAILLTVLAIFILSHLITRPLVRMKRATEEIINGDSKVSLESKRKDELGQLANSIVILSDELERLKQDRKEFLASISHELRTPLTYIKGYANIASRDMISEAERQEYLGIIREETDHVTHLVKNLFDLAKMDQNQFVIQKENVNLCDMLKKVREKMLPILNDNELNLDITCPTNIIIYVDPDRFQQVILNLMDNAIKHSPKQSTIYIVGKVNMAKVAITVQDEGEGIPEEELPFIFERLYRVDKSRSREYGGSGLGLSIVKEIIEKHGGEVKVESVVGNGTKMTILLNEEDIVPYD
ncbi:HAMP domain-containing protein [Pontibacillus yanchengensis]|uniref:HAMP domain-containing protein n=2 Tax=Pontibacillus yanchengensis TaxID=462910 RepID=A0ACC7VDN7_9BACI|nr:HAMP domain-containing sensor histidine kinase [Pontibacillus yanchengensis]MYL32130.1 HAMP domain-containing protein [Pontibacillus yanchengensis]MYL52710.1 HAMP domain-containing protein [Pontibacillus yanchengensis]